MALPTDIRIVSLEHWTTESPFRAPLKFGGNVVSFSLNLHVRAVVETRDGRRAAGHGMMPAGSVWGFPSKVVTAAEAADAGLDLFERAVAATRDFDGFAHPIQIALDCEPAWLALAADVSRDRRLAEPIPKLFCLVECSPIDAALHDAFGKVLGLNVYNAYSADFVGGDLSGWLGAGFTGRHLDEFTSRAPKPSLPLYHLVGALDALTPDEVASPIADGLPEHLAEWIAFDDLTHLKVKLNGDDVAWDAQRVAAIERVATEAMGRLGRDTWVYSLDFNERCQNVAYILEFLQRVEELAPTAFARAAYIEQPTARDLAAHPENLMHQAAAIKPVVIDESLVDDQSYDLARAQGYSGVALKTCKGHSHALLAAARAQVDGLFLCVQDLTCPGASFLHSAGLAARIPTVTAIEGNARQYCPGSNAELAARYPATFKPRAGRIDTSPLTLAGLGH